MSKQLEGLISRRAADLSVLDTLVEGEGGVGRSGWDRMEKGPGGIFIRDRSQETLLCAPVAKIQAYSKVQIYSSE